MQIYRKSIPLNTPGGRKTAKLLLTIILLGISAVFIAVGAIIFKVNKSKQDKCTEKVTATVVDLLEQTNTSSHKGRRRTSISYRPVFEYIYNDVTYVTESNISSNPPEYEIGETVDLMIDPDKPRRIYDPGSNLLRLMGFIFGGVGILMMIIYIIIMIIMGKLKDKENPENTEIDYYEENQY